MFKGFKTKAKKKFSLHGNKTDYIYAVPTLLQFDGEQYIIHLTEHTLTDKGKIDKSLEAPRTHIIVFSPDAMNTVDISGAQNTHQIFEIIIDFFLKKYLVEHERFGLKGVDWEKV